MSNVVAWLVAEANPQDAAGGHFPWRQDERVGCPDRVGSESGNRQTVELQSGDLHCADSEEERQRRIYRGRTVAMLRRYMRYSMETGRLPSVLGLEFFRAKVTSYSVNTFEDRVIFVHDMEICLERLDEFSRQLIARHILQEHDQAATARLLGCADRTVRTYMPIVLDMLSGILLEVGLMDPMEASQGR